MKHLGEHTELAANVFGVESYETPIKSLGGRTEFAANVCGVRSEVVEFA